MEGERQWLIVQTATPSSSLMMGKESSWLLKKFHRRTPSQSLKKMPDSPSLLPHADLCATCSIVPRHL